MYADIAYCITYAQIRRSLKVVIDKTWDMLPERIFHAESNGDGPVTVRSRKSVQNGHKTYAHKWSSFKVVIDETWDMLPEWIFHAESNSDGPVAVRSLESVQNGHKTLCP